jgi:thiol:disulfide interchange protein
VFRTIAAIVTAAFLALLFCIGSPAQAATNHIRASLLAEKPARPGETVMLALLMQPDKGWHGYWQNPGDAGLPPELEWTLPKGSKVGPMQFPVPQTLLVAGLMNHVYEHEFAVLIPFTIPADATPGTTLPLSAKASWLACTEAVCVPEDADLAGTVIVGEGAADARFAAWRAALPAPLDRTGTFTATKDGWRLAIPFPAGAKVDKPHFFVSAEGLVDYAAPQVFRRKDDLLIVDLPRSKSPSAEQATTLAGVLALGGDAGGISLVAKAGPVPDEGTPLEGGAAAAGTFTFATLWLAILGALAGGLVLNVMPCVFPILSLKALALARGNAEKAHHEALAYTAGVVLACLGLGAAMLALRAAGEQVGWAFQLQDPGVVAVLLLLAVAITANFAGLFELPGLSLERGAGSMGAFGTGLLAAFVATPCTGPFMAAAMGAALVLPAWAALAVFAALGVGLALPFLLLGFVPPLRRLLPKPGAWMNTFRRVMAVPMALTVLALGWLAWRLGGANYALVALTLAIALVAVLAVAGRVQKQGKPVARWAAPAGVALAALALVVTPRLAAEKAQAAESLIGAKPFSAAALAQAKASGKPVFLYFTADWCLSCKVNEGVAIETDATHDAFAKAGVQVLVGDWTRRDPAITAFLETQGAAGVPLYLWYPAGSPTPQKLPQVLGPETLAGLAKGKS